MNVWDEKNSIELKKNSSNNNVDGLNDIMISIPKSCEKNECKNIGWTRNCPKCGKTIAYSLQSNFCRARKNNSVCFECGKLINRRFTGKKHSTKSNEKRRLTMSNKKYRHSEEIRKSISVRMMGNKHSTGKPKPEHWKRKLIQKMVEGYSLRENIGKSFLPNYNRIACEYFDWLNKFMGWDGQYATYRGEKNVLSYFVDYYEPSLNIVIEWDEGYHRRKKKKDKLRQNEIKIELGCRFFRYDELTKEMKEV